MTKFVCVTVIVDVAKGTVAVDVRVVMPIASPVLASSVAEPIPSGVGVLGETVTLALNPVLPSSLVEVVTPISGVAQLSEVLELLKIARTSVDTNPG